VHVQRSTCASAIPAILLLAAVIARADGPGAGGSREASAPVQTEAEPAPSKAAASVESVPAPAKSEAAGAASAAQPRTDPGSVFHIERNKNRNEVHYGIRLDPACEPDGAEPVYNYWLRLEDGPGITKPVTLFQQVGYGISEQSVTAQGVRVVLRAMPQRPITIRTSREGEKCKADASIEIAGASARFDHAYVFAEAGLVKPTVKYVELFGVRADGTAAHEHVDVD